jgi:hypothetical protein
MELEFLEFLRLSVFILSLLALYFDWSMPCLEYDGKFLDILKCRLNFSKLS